MTRAIAFRRAAIAAILALALSSFALAGGSSKRLEVFGRVLNVDKKAGTMLVSDHWTKKLYLISVPENASFKITFGMYKNLGQPDLDHVFKHDQVRMLCEYKDKEHLATLEDGRQVTVLTVAK